MRLVLIISVIALIILALWQLPKLQTRGLMLPSDRRLDLENQLRKTVGQLVGGAAILGGLYFTWRNVEIAFFGQVTERFATAVDQLGSEKEAVRVGAVYVFERIALESLEDQANIEDILQTFVRSAAPASLQRRFTPARDLWGAWGCSEDRSYAPPADVRAALLVIGRLQQRSPRRILNLAGADLRGADLRNFHLEKAILIGAHMQEAHLAQADLDSANLTGATMACAVLDSASLRFANLFNADLRGSQMVATNLDGTVFLSADLSGARLRSVHLRGHVFPGTCLSGTDVRHVSLRDVQLTTTQLRVLWTDSTTVVPSRVSPSSRQDSLTECEVIARFVRGLPSK